MFVTTHYMDEAEYCDRMSIMVDGKIEALDTPAALKRASGPTVCMMCFQSCPQGQAHLGLGGVSIVFVLMIII